MKSTLSVLLSLIFMGMVVACGNDSQSTSTDSSKSTTGDSIEGVAGNDSTQTTTIAHVDTLSANCTADQAMNYMKKSGHWDKYSTGVITTIVNQHLPYARKLINNKYKHFIIVDKGSMQVLLYDKYGHLKLNYKMACGRNYGHKRKKADCRTPEGIFECGGWFDSTNWLYTNDWGYTSPARGQFGPRFIRVCPQIGIHGTSARYSIGNRCSHGCIRIQNENVLELVKYVEAGMPIIVNPGPRDVAANKQNGVDSPALELPNISSLKSQEATDTNSSNKKAEKKTEKKTEKKADKKVETTKKDKSTKTDSASKKKESTVNKTETTTKQESTDNEAKPEQKGQAKPEQKGEPKREPKAPEKPEETPAN